jgi:SAM-dependent methyltransferase
MQTIEIITFSLNMPYTTFTVHNYFMDDLWTVTETPVGYGMFQDGLEHVIDQHPKDELSVLDVGSSTGEAFSRLLEDLERSLDSSLEGYSLEPRGVVYRGRDQGFHENPVQGIVGTEDHSIPFKEGSFDIVISNNLFPYIDDQREALEDVRYVLDDGGYAAVHVGTDTGKTERWITEKSNLEGLDSMDLDRDENMIHADTRGELPKGFYDDFYDGD